MIEEKVLERMEKEQGNFRVIVQARNSKYNLLREYVVRERYKIIYDSERTGAIVIEFPGKEIRELDSKSFVYGIFDAQISDEELV
jgi:hypothetical protein